MRRLNTYIDTAGARRTGNRGRAKGSFPTTLRLPSCLSLDFLIIGECRPQTQAARPAQLRHKFLQFLCGLLSSRARLRFTSYRDGETEKLILRSRLHQRQV